MSKKKIVLLSIASILLLVIISCGAVLAHYSYVEYKREQLYDKFEENKNNTEITVTVPSEENRPSAPSTVVDGVEFYEETDSYYVNIDKLPIYTRPAENSEILGYKYAGDLVDVISTSNYWSCIDFEGKEGYVAGECLGKTYMFDAEIYEEMKLKGNVGRLVIPSLNMNIALYTADSLKDDRPYGQRIQSVVDEWDSAAYLEDIEGVYGMTRIADHNYQGFDNMRELTVNETKGYIHFGTSRHDIVCTALFNGYNIYEDLTDLDGESIRGKNDGGYCLYTCNRNGTILLTYWRIITEDGVVS